MDIIFDTSVIDYGRALAFKSSCFNVKLQVTPLLRNPSHYLKDEKFFKDEMTGTTDELTTLENIFFQAVELQIPLCETTKEKEYLQKILLKNKKS